MNELLLPVLAALFLWWFGTGAVFLVAGWGIARNRRDLVMAGATAMLGLALWGLVQLGPETSLAAAYLSFGCGLAAWAWLEAGFLLGHLTGPQKAPCPPGARGARRFLLALGTILWHELAILALGAAMVTLTWGMANQTGTWTFVLLMAMRVSAKLNLFLGVPYPPTPLLPRHLQHMGTFFRRAPITPLMPGVITLATAVATLVAWRAADPALDAFHLTAYMLFWTMLVLGIVEHWFLILPVQDAAIWRWFLGPGMDAREPCGNQPGPCSKSNAPSYRYDSFRNEPSGSNRKEVPVLVPLQTAAKRETR